MKVHLASAHEPRWPMGLLAILAVGCVIVPCAFTTRVQAVFAVPKLAVLWTMLAVCLGVVAAGALRVERLPASARPIWRVDGPVLAFVGLSLAAWVASPDHRQSLYGEQLQYQGVLTLLLYVGFFYVARLAVAERQSVGVLLWAVAGGATLVSAYALVQRVGLDPIWDGYLPGGRVFSSIGQANALAAYLVLAAPLGAALVLGARGLRRVLFLLATMTIVAAFLFAQSRGGYLGLGLAFLVLTLGWWREVGLRSRHLAIGAALVVAIAIGAGSQSSSVAEAFRPMSTRSDASVRFHLDAWRVAAAIIEDHPLLGTGPETFPDVFPRYSHDVLPRERALALDAFRVESPHNVYLAIAAGSGVPALIAYLGVIGGFFAIVLRAFSRMDRSARIVLTAILAAATGHLVTDAFMTAELTGSWAFWLLLGATLGWISSEEGGGTCRERELHGSP